MVEALTSCAIDYRTWADELPAGSSEENGVLVHRLPVVAPRDGARFDRWNERLITGPQPVPLELQERWLLEQGPVLRGLRDHVADLASTIDLVVAGPYLYPTTVQALRFAAADRIPSLLHPLAHQEPTLGFSLYDSVVRLASGLAFATPEESALYFSRFGQTDRPHEVVGLGLDSSARGNAGRFRQQFELGDRPYLLLLGRVDASKGSFEALEMHRAFRARHPAVDLVLVVMGRPSVECPEEPGVLYTGFVPDQTRSDALAGAVALVQPSYFESFSLVLAESWVQGRPAVVQGVNDVLVGQAQRSGGALTYRGYPRYEACIELMLSEPDLATQMGEAGAHYVRTNYGWNAVLARYEHLMRRTCPASPRVLG